VFGGMRNEGGREVFLNDIYRLTSNADGKTIWKNKTPGKGDRPAPRYGHSMICVYHYLIVFGG